MLSTWVTSAPAAFAAYDAPPVYANKLSTLGWGVPIFLMVL
jgi:hypothetical protein